MAPLQEEKGYAQLTDNQLQNLQSFFRRNKIPHKKIAALSGFKHGSISSMLAFKKPTLKSTLTRLLNAARTYCRQTDRVLLAKFDVLLKKNACETYIRK